MSLYSERLVDALGLIPMQAKANEPNVDQPSAQSTGVDAPVTPAKTEPSEPAPTSQSIHIEKNEYRLLIKMLQAIDHDCEFKRISQVFGGYAYQHPNIELRFTGLDAPDSQDTMHLATLSDLIAQPALKRPVWEKLKTLKS